MTSCYVQHMTPEELRMNFESLHSSLSELYGITVEQGENIAELRSAVSDLVIAVQKDGEHINALVRLAEIHDHRTDGV